MNKNQKGFSLPHILLVLVLIGATGFAGWRVYDLREKVGSASNGIDSMNQERRKEEKKEEYKPVIPEGWKIYENDEYGFSFAYPETWGELKEEAYPGGGYDASKDWLLYRTSNDTKDQDSTGLFNKLRLEINTKEYQEFRISKAGTPHIYVNKDGQEYWAASGTVDVEFDDYKPGDRFDVPIEKVIKDTNIYKIYWDYEGTIGAAWRFPVAKGIVTIHMPLLGHSNMMTGEITGDEDQYKELAHQIFNSIDK